MRSRTKLLIALPFILLSCGCLGGPYYGAGYSIYTYDGIVYTATYDDIYMEESVLVTRILEANASFTLGNSYRYGHYIFYILDEETNETDHVRYISLLINDCELAPGYSDDHRYSGENNFITNVSLSYTIHTEQERYNMGSEDKDEADALSEEIFQIDLAANSAQLEYFDEMLLEIFNREPTYEHLGRDYLIECVD